jgi:ribonucleoside-diphosphate reductase alpha chain
VKLRLPQYLSSNELTPLGRKTFLDRYAKKAPKTDPLSPGDLVVICTNPDPDNRQQEVGEVVAHNSDGRTVTVRTEGGEDHVVDVEAVDKPLEKTPEELMDRVSAALAEIEEDSDKWTARFRQLLDNWGFVPAGRILTGAGIQRKTPLTFFNCNVIPAPKDSRAGIMKTGSQLSELFSRGAGVGTHLSSLRPRYSYVKGVNGRSSGSVSWGSLFSHITGLIEQGGCLAGESLVATAQGNIPIRDLVGTTPWVYSYDLDRQEVCLKQATWVGKTGTDRPMVQLETDKGLRLSATPDHPILCRDGQYRPAGELTSGMRIMPLRRFWSRGKEPMVQMKLGDRALPAVYGSDTPLHRFVYSQAHGVALESSDVVHHKDGNHENNDLENLELLDITGHHRLHGKQRVAEGTFALQDYWREQPREVRVAHSKKGNEALLAGLRGKQGEEKRAWLKERLSHKARTDNAMKDPANKAKVARGHAINTAFKLLNHSIDISTPEKWDRALYDNRVTRTKKRYGLGCIPTLCPRSKKIIALFGSYAAFMESLEVQNHVVTQVTEVAPGDVYDLEVPVTHNFAVVTEGDTASSGIFVHNSRRGALMLVLHVWHPDVLEFIECKREPKAKKLAELADKLEFGLGLKDMADEARQLAADWPKAISHANLSVGITDDFMDAVIHDRDWKLIFPDTSHPDYEEHWDGDIQEWQDAGRPVKVHKVLKARELWEKLMHSAWDSAEPGVIYIDTINSTSTSWWYCKLLATNPCGEQPLPSWYGCCNLGALNLPRFLKEDPENPNRIIMDWDAYEEAITDAIRFLDNVIGTTPYFFQEQEENAKFERRVGLSPFMGLAEALALLGLRYGSDEAVEFINTEIGPFAARKALWASVKLAEEKGPAPVLETEGARRSFLESKYVRRAMDRMPSDEREDFVEAVMEYGLRNISLTTSAPTGSIGTLVATSTGIEPFFLFEYKHRTNLGLHIKRERVLEEWHRQHGEKATPPDFFVTAAKLTPTEHVRMQAALQRWIDSAISKTTNLPAEYTPEDVGNFYMDLWKRGCKGGTVYREGSRTVQVLSSVDGPEAPIKKYASLFPEKIELVGRNDRDGKTWTVDTPGGTLHATINHHPDTDQPFETFIRVGKGGSDLSAMSEAFGRLMSLDLQLQGPVQSRRRCEMIADQLEGIGGRDQVGFGPNKVRSIPDGVAKAMRMHLEWMDGRKAAAEAVRLWNEEEGATECEDHEARIDALRKGLDMCPDCGQITLRLEEGCTSCALCGYSKC